MNYVSKNISINLKKIRHAKKMSLDDMSEQTGVSKSMLGQIERGESNPTVETLAKIVSGLRIGFEDLMDEPREPVYHVGYDEMIPTKDVSGQYKVYTYFSFTKNRKFEIYMIEIEPGGAYESGSHGEKTEEYITVVEGDLTMTISGEEYLVRNKDAMRFDSDVKHVYMNKGSKKVVLMVYFVFHSKV